MNTFKQVCYCLGTWGRLGKVLPACALPPLRHRSLGVLLLPEAVLPLEERAGDGAGVPRLLAQLLVEHLDVFLGVTISVFL
jgi:hypothetical protein